MLIILGLKRPDRESDYSSLSSDNFYSLAALYLYPIYTFMARCVGAGLTTHNRGVPTHQELCRYSFLKNESYLTSVPFAYRQHQFILRVTSLRTK